MQTPKVFISYSHDSDEHKNWVYQLACKLQASGVEILLDQWEVEPGANLHNFMERGLRDSDRVLVVCTDQYNRKANDGLGGVGYEKNILTPEFLQSQDTKKFIPCIRGVSTNIKTPTYLSSRVYIDFTNDAEFDANLENLLRNLHENHSKSKPPLGKNPFALPEKETLPSISGECSTVFFSKRFSDAFPGVRGIEWSREPTAAVERLRLFFKKPFVFRESIPIWCWRRSQFQIDNFEVFSADTVLLGHEEFVIDELAAINAGAYYQSFLYLRVKPSEPTGLYGQTSISSQIEDWGYANEEFGLFRGLPVSREEYDDGSAVIDGNVVDMNGEAKLRVRYVTPYNLLIAPRESPINNNSFDQRRNNLLNAILRSGTSLETLVGEVLQLPKITRT